MTDKPDEPFVPYCRDCAFCGKLTYNVPLAIPDDVNFVAAMPQKSAFCDTAEEAWDRVTANRRITVNSYICFGLEFGPWTISEMRTFGSPCGPMGALFQKKV